MLLAEYVELPYQNNEKLKITSNNKNTNYNDSYHENNIHGA